MLEQTRYKAQGGWVIIRKCYREQATIALLNDAKYENYCEVTDVGPGRVADNGTRIEPRIKVGDLVIIKGGPRIIHPIPGDEEHAAVLEEDIITTVNASVPVTKVEDDTPRIARIH